MMSQARKMTAKLLGSRIPDEVYNTADVIDSRDVIARIEYLEEEREGFAADHEFASAEEGEDAACIDCGLIREDHKTVEGWAEENPDEAEELKTLEALAEEASGSADWQHGETLIRESYFEEYAQELAEDIGAISKDATWPNNHIDWEAAAEALQQDYTSVTFDGVGYLIRS